MSSTKSCPGTSTPLTTPDNVAILLYHWFVHLADWSLIGANTNVKFTCHPEKNRTIFFLQHLFRGHFLLNMSKNIFLPLCVQKYILQLPSCWAVKTVSHAWLPVVIHYPGHYPGGVTPFSTTLILLYLHNWLLFEGCSFYCSSKSSFYFQDCK